MHRTTEFPCKAGNDRSGNATSRNPFLFRRASWILAALASLALTACSQLEQFVQTPRVSLVGLELGDLSFTQQGFVAHIEVYNPNSFNLPMRGFTWAVSLQNVALASGVSDHNASIPAGATSRLSLNFSTDLLTTALGLMQLLQSPEQTIGYRIEGEIRTDLPFVGEIPYSHEGTVLVIDGG